MATTKIRGVIVQPVDVQPGAPGWSVHFDVELTRRKVFHAVTNPQGELVYRSRRAADLFDFLDDYEIYEYTLHTASGDFAVTSRRVKRNKRV